jgi:hypothetical protein
MRTYDEMFADFLKWQHLRTGDESLLPETYLDPSIEEEELNMRKAGIWDDILTLCYDNKHGFYYFGKFILGDLTYAGYPDPIRINSLWYSWTQLLQTSDHLCIECPRQHGKSTFWTVVYPLFKLAMYENYNVAIISASEDQAVMLLSFMARIVESNEFLMSKRAKGAKWSSTEISYNGGIVRAKGVGSEIRGGTYDYVICDDILRSDNKLSDTEIENFIKEETEATILVRRGQLVIVGTPKHPQDIFSNVLDMIEEVPDCGWVFRRYQAILDDATQTLLCPDRFTYQQLMQKKKIIGALKFDKEFMCLTYSSGSQLFTDEIVKIALDKGRTWELHKASKKEDDMVWAYYIGVDVARSGAAGADFTVITVLAYNDETQEKRVVFMYRKKGMKIPQQSKIVAQIAHNFEYPPVLVEKNNIGVDMIDELIDNYNLNVESFTTGASNNKKDDLIRLLISSFENEKVIIPNKTEEDKLEMKPLLGELKKFISVVTRAGNEQMRGAGKSHDDCVMSLALANRCTVMSGARPFAKMVDKKHFDTDLERLAYYGDIEDIIRL